MRLTWYVLAAALALAGFVGSAAPASAAPDTGQIVGDGVNLVLRPTGCWVTYQTLLVVTVYNPLSPTNKLVTVSVPIPAAVFCGITDT